MTHLPEIIGDLAFLLVVAGIVTILFKWLKQPVVLGYIIAGFLAGPHISFFPTVANTESINIWGEIGVIFLLFGMGLEFSFKKLIQNGKTGFITLLMIVLGLGVTGYLLGMAMDWGQANSIILGCMLCLSSTTIIVKGFEDPRFKGKRFTEVVFGILIFDDLFAILTMVFLGTLAVSRSFEGTDILFSSGKLIFFMVVWVVCGIFIIPTFLRKVRRMLNDETLLIVSLGMCLGLVVFATEVGLSSALGAFIMGSILAETVALENIERVTKPIKDFFGAIFFVSVGMIMDPTVVVDHLWSILMISGLVIVGKIIFTTLGARLAGENMLVSTQAGFSMAQVGEFAFIVAGSAIVYGIADDFIYPIIIAVSILTTFTTPYLMAAGTGAYDVMMRTMPASLRRRIEERDFRLSQPKPASTWSLFLRNYIFKVVIFSSVSLAAIILSFSFLLPLLQDTVNTVWSDVICLVITFLVIAPMLVGLVFAGGEQTSLSSKLWSENFRNKAILVLLSILKYVIAVGFIYFVFDTLLSDVSIWVVLALTAFVFLLVTRSTFFLKMFWNIEYKFILNFNQRAIDDKRQQSRSHTDLIAFDLDNESWIEQNLYVAMFKLEPGSEYENMRLEDSDFRSKYKLLIVDIHRGDEDKFFPSCDYVLLAGDIITVVGDFLQINLFARAKNRINLQPGSMKTFHEFSKMQEIAESHIKGVSLIVDKNTGLYQKSLSQCDIGRIYDCFVVGIERHDRYEINPPASTVFQDNDIIWIIGKKDSISEIVKANFHI